MRPLLSFRSSDVFFLVEQQPRHRTHASEARRQLDLHHVDLIRRPKAEAGPEQSEDADAVTSLLLLQPFSQFSHSAAVAIPAMYGAVSGRRGDGDSSHRHHLGNSGNGSDGDRRPLLDPETGCCSARAILMR